MHVERYGNTSGDSGVTHYEIGPDYIDVRFVNDGTYQYNFTKPGQMHVHRMKQLALSGTGLSSYISKYVRNNYAFKK